MKNLLVIGLLIGVLGGCVSRGEVRPAVSQFNPTDLSHFSYLAKIDEESSLNTERYVEVAYEETVTEEKETVPEANDNRQKTSTSFFTWNENMEQSELN
ncbi:MAG: hypothetical protein FD173_439 [Gallionellaceae bacterium]|nr:MAG: hypothetical protein FD173_439 [Gallionellaceae bacterium]